MATTKTKKSKEYISQATTISISATSRISLKIRDNFYTVEFSEERSIPNTADIEKERKLLWDTVNEEVDNQAVEIKQMFK